MRKQTNDNSTKHLAGALSNKPQAVFALRPKNTVSCPHCWTEQRALRNNCYHCGARFIYTGETVPDCKAE